MAYIPETWVDRNVERPNTYTEVVNSDGTKTFIPSPGTVIEPGTHVSATKLNKIEQGIVASNTWVSGESTLAYTSFNGQTSQTQALDLGADYNHIEILAVHYSLTPKDQNWARRVVVMGISVFHELFGKNGLFSALDLNLSNNKIDWIQDIGDGVALYKVTKSGSILTFYAFNNYAAGTYKTGSLRVIWRAK